MVELGICTIWNGQKSIFVQFLDLKKYYKFKFFLLWSSEIEVLVFYEC